LTAAWCSRSAAGTLIIAYAQLMMLLNLLRAAYAMFITSSKDAIMFWNFTQVDSHWLCIRTWLITHALAAPVQYFSMQVACLVTKSRRICLLSQDCAAWRHFRALWRILHRYSGYPHTFAEPRVPACWVRERFPTQIHMREQITWKILEQRSYLIMMLRTGIAAYLASPFGVILIGRVRAPHLYRSITAGNQTDQYANKSAET